MIVFTKQIDVCTLSDALAAHERNQAKLSRVLNVNRSTLRKYLEQGERYLVKVTKEIDGSANMELINKG